MALRTYLYQGSVGITSVDLVPLLAVGAGPVVQAPSQFGFLPITVDSSHKADLDAAMADLGYAYVGLYTDLVLPATTKDYGALAADPLTPPAAAGDTYYNTVLQMRMAYEAVRAKWLSVEAQEFTFGRNGATATGQYYRTTDGRILSATLGWRAGFPGTVVSLQYTRSDADAATFEVVANGAPIGTLVSAASAGGSNALDSDFVAADILAVRNQAGGNNTSDVVAYLRLRWRSP